MVLISGTKLDVGFLSRTKCPGKALMFAKFKTHTQLNHNSYTCQNGSHIATKHSHTDAFRHMYAYTINVT